MKYTPDEDKPAIVFAFFDKNDNFIGFRQDTVGTIGDHPKIYHYSDEQVKIVMDNIEYNTEKKSTNLGGFLEKIDPSMGAIVKKASANVTSLLNDLGEFRVKILPCPDINEDWSYPNLDIWKLTVNSIQPIKTFKFKCNV